MSVLNERSLLVQLTIRSWSGRKYDRKVSEEVAASNGATSSAGRYNKVLLPSGESLKAVHSMDGAMRGYFYENTLPWGLDGTHILPTRNYLRFTQEFGALKNKREQLVSSFLAVYEELQQAAQGYLGALYRPEDYPPLEDVRGRFGVTLAVMPVPSADFRTELSDAETERLKAEHLARLSEAESTAMRELWSRLYERVQKIAAKLAEPDAIFRDTLIENAQEICSLLPRLNVTDDPRLEQMRQEVEGKLLVNPEVLRANELVRADTAQAAEDIMAKMKAYMEGF